MRVKSLMFFLIPLVLTGCKCCFHPASPECRDDGPKDESDFSKYPGFIELKWDKDKADLDLYVISPSGQIAWADNKEIHSGSFGTDFTDGRGFGPEHFVVKVAESGHYTVKVNYHWHYDQSEDVTATVNVYRHGVLDENFKQTRVFRKSDADGNESNNPPNAWVVTTTLTFP